MHILKQQNHYQKTNFYKHKHLFDSPENKYTSVCWILYRVYMAKFSLIGNYLVVDEEHPYKICSFNSKLRCDFWEKRLRILFQRCNILILNKEKRKLICKFFICMKLSICHSSNIVYPKTCTGSYNP